jgi:hypothetical protein
LAQAGGGFVRLWVGFNRASRNGTPPEPTHTLGPLLRGQTGAREHLASWGQSRTTTTRMQRSSPGSADGVSEVLHAVFGADQSMPRC